jgi:hypothetical protein
MQGCRVYCCTAVSREQYGLKFEKVLMPLLLYIPSPPPPHRCLLSKQKVDFYYNHSEPFIRQINVVRKVINSTHILLKRPLMYDLKEEWSSPKGFRISNWNPLLLANKTGGPYKAYVGNRFGIENLSVRMKSVPYKVWGLRWCGSKISLHVYVYIIYSICIVS